MPRCVDCVHQSQIDWSRGITELSGYCTKGNEYIGKHVNKQGVNISLHAQRKCPAFKPKTTTGASNGKETVLGGCIQTVTQQERLGNSRMKNQRKNSLKE